MLNTIYDNLMNGMKYGYVVKGKNIRYPYWHEVLGKHWCKPYFFWNNYGSSANRANKKELKFIIEVIFKMTPEEFVKKYECRKAGDYHVE